MAEPSLTIKSLLERLREEHADVVAFRIKRNGAYVEFSGREVVRKAEALGAHLASLGVRPGDRVGLLADNLPEWGMAYLGIVGHGMTAVPIDRLLKPQEYQRILADAGAVALLVSDAYAEDVQTIRPALPELKHLLRMEQAVHADPAAPAPDHPVRPDDLAALIYTSGTTGQPKGVMLSHRNIMANVVGCSRAISYSRGDNFLSVLPLHHTFECTAGLLAPLYGGASVTYVGSLKSRDIIDAMQETRATIMLGVPLLYEKMYAGILRAVKSKPAPVRLVFSLSMGVVKIAEAFGWRLGRTVFRSLREKGGFGSMRFFVSGAAALPPEVARGFDRLGMRILQGYGLTEASPVVSVNRYDRPKHDSIGPPIPGVEVRIVHPDEAGIGELAVRGDNVMQGYYRNPEATADVLRDGWLHTGDSGWVDRDGHYHIAGRLKNVIVTRAGKNIYPEEIEAELVLSPYIAEVVVLGAVDEKTGEEFVRAIVVPDYEYLQQNGVATDDGAVEALVRREVRAICDTMADYKRVREVEIRKEEFPKTSTRKVKRYLLQSKQTPASSDVKTPR
jgi:long-chain acyl-CoA synthetase